MNCSEIIVNAGLACDTISKTGVLDEDPAKSLPNVKSKKETKVQHQNDNLRYIEIIINQILIQLYTTEIHLKLEETKGRGKDMNTAGKYVIVEEEKKEYMKTSSQKRI